MINALVCVIDNTLADGISWYKITECLGASVAEHKIIFDSFLAGTISYEESKVQLLSLWRSNGNANKTYLSSVFDEWLIRYGVVELLDSVRQQG